MNSRESCPHPSRLRHIGESHRTSLGPCHVSVNPDREIKKQSSYSPIVSVVSRHEGHLMKMRRSWNAWSFLLGNCSCLRSLRGYSATNLNCSRTHRFI